MSTSTFGVHLEQLWKEDIEDTCFKSNFYAVRVPSFNIIRAEIRLLSIIVQDSVTRL